MFWVCFSVKLWFKINRERSERQKLRKFSVCGIKNIDSQPFGGCVKYTNFKTMSYSMNSLCTWITHRILFYYVLKLDYQYTLPKDVFSKITSVDNTFEEMVFLCQMIYCDIYSPTFKCSRIFYNILLLLYKQFWSK